MKIFGMRIAGGLTACLMGLVWLTQPGRLMAQTAAPASARRSQWRAYIGHVNDPLGVTVTSGEVRLRTDRSAKSANRKYDYRSRSTPAATTRAAT